MSRNDPNRPPSGRTSPFQEDFGEYGAMPDTLEGFLEQAASHLTAHSNVPADQWDYFEPPPGARPQAAFMSSHPVPRTPETTIEGDLFADVAQPSPEKPPPARYSPLELPPSSFSGTPPSPVRRGSPQQPQVPLVVPPPRPMVVQPRTTGEKRYPVPPRPQQHQQQQQPFAITHSPAFRPLMMAPSPMYSASPIGSPGSSSGSSSSGSSGERDRRESRQAGAARPIPYDIESPIPYSPDAPPNKVMGRPRTVGVKRPRYASTTSTTPSGFVESISPPVAEEDVIEVESANTRRPTLPIYYQSPTTGGQNVYYPAAQTPLYAYQVPPGYPHHPPPPPGTFYAPGPYGYAAGGQVPPQVPRPPHPIQPATRNSPPRPSTHQVSDDPLSPRQYNARVYISNPNISESLPPITQVIRQRTPPSIMIADSPENRSIERVSPTEVEETLFVDFPYHSITVYEEEEGGGGGGRGGGSQGSRFMPYWSSGVMVSIHGSTLERLADIAEKLQGVKWKPQVCTVVGDTDRQIAFEDARGLVTLKVNHARKTARVVDIKRLTSDSQEYDTLSSMARMPPLRPTCPMHSVAARTLECMATVIFFATNQNVLSEVVRGMLGSRPNDPARTPCLDMMYYKRFMTPLPASVVGIPLMEIHLQIYRGFLDYLVALTAGVHHQYDPAVARMRIDNVNRNHELQFPAVNSALLAAVREGYVAPSSNFDLARRALLSSLDGAFSVFGGEIYNEAVVDLMNPYDGYVAKMYASGNPWASQAVLTWVDYVCQGVYVAAVSNKFEGVATSDLMGDVIYAALEYIRACMRLSILDLLSLLGTGIDLIRHNFKEHLQVYFVRAMRSVNNRTSIMESGQDYVVTNIPVGKELMLSLINPLFRFFVMGDIQMTAFCLTHLRIQVQPFLRKVFGAPGLMSIIPDSVWLVPLLTSREVNQSIPTIHWKDDQCFYMQIGCVALWRMAVALQTGDEQYVRTISDKGSAYTCLQVMLQATETIRSQFKLGEDAVRSIFRKLAQGLVRDRVQTVGTDELIRVVAERTAKTIMPYAGLLFKSYGRVIVMDTRIQMGEIADPGSSSSSSSSPFPSSATPPVSASPAAPRRGSRRGKQA